jgi:uracil-DNA glycosylase
MSEREELLADLAERTRILAGWASLGVPRQTLVTRSPAVASAVSTAPSPARAGSPVVATVAASSGAASDREAGLAAIRATIGDCQRCKLAGGRKTIVFGQGDPNARLMFVGEAPGADEDEQGLAFVGRAGQLLTDIIEKGMRLRRADVFIANIIKCRPPQNRNPEPDEILACQGFLEQQIDTLQPKVIVALGKFSGQWLLKTAEPISRLRGRLGEFRGIRVMPTFHPAYLLRNPAAKKEVWEDVKVVLRLLEE